MKTLISALALVASTASFANAADINLATFNTMTNHTEVCGNYTDDFFSAKDELGSSATVQNIVDEINNLFNCGADVEMQAHVMTTTFADEVADIMESEGRVFFENPWGATRVLAEVGSVDGVAMYEVRKVELTTQESKWVGRYKIENGKKVKVGMATETSTRITQRITWGGKKVHTLATALTELSDRKYSIQD